VFGRKERVVALELDISSLMDEQDHEYCSKQFGLDINMVRGMRDKDWIEFFGCTKEDLPFYLIDEDRWGDIDDAYDSLFLADEVDEPFGFGYESDTEDQPDLWDALASDGSLLYPSSTRGNAYSTKVVPIKKAKPKPVPHYFVIVR
jgi:hypothetical protein